MAAGARVKVTIAGLPEQLAEVRLGSGYLSASTTRLMFAKPAGYAGDVKIWVRWPDGTDEERTVSAKGEITIDQSKKSQVEVTQTD